MKEYLMSLKHETMPLLSSDPKHPITRIQQLYGHSGRMGSIWPADFITIKLWFTYMQVYGLAHMCTKWQILRYQKKNPTTEC